MSRLRNLLGNFMPHLEARSATGVLAAANAEVVLDLSGDEHALINLDGGAGTLNTTYNIQGSADGTNYFDLLAYALPPGWVGGTIAQAGQPLLSEAVNAANIRRVLCVATGGLDRIRVRLSAWTAGAATVTINSDACASISPYVRELRAATLMVTATGAAAAAVTATLPAVAGLRHYIDRVSVVKFQAAALTAAATPVLVTTTNMPGNPVLSFSAGAEAQGTTGEQVLDFGGAGLAVSAINTATTVVCPVTTGVIWRVNVAYRLGL